MTERPKFIRKTVFQGSGNPSTRFEECQAENTEIEPKLQKIIKPMDFLPGWTKLLQQCGLDVQLELSISEELTNQE